MSYYKNGIITIPNVSGNIVITATAVASGKPNLFEKSPSKQSTSTEEVPGDMVYLGARINSSRNVVFHDYTQLVTRPIAVSYGDILSIETDLANGPHINYKGTASFYDINGTYIASISTKYYDGTRWNWDSAYKKGTLKVESPPEADISGAAYVRFTLAYTNIDNIVITK